MASETRLVSKRPYPPIIVLRATSLTTRQITNRQQGGPRIYVGLPPPVGQT